MTTSQIKDSCVVLIVITMIIGIIWLFGSGELFKAVYYDDRGHKVVIYNEVKGTNAWQKAPP